MVANDALNCNLERLCEVSCCSLSDLSTHVSILLVQSSSRSNMSFTRLFFSVNLILCRNLMFLRRKEELSTGGLAKTMTSRSCFVTWEGQRQQLVSWGECSYLLRSF